MIQHPGIVALLLGSLLTSLLLLHAGWHGVAILRRWDPTSGSEAQVQLERRTSLITALVGLALLMELASLLLFVHTADGLHDRLAGAMCAAGTLAANGFGYPALLAKLAASLLAGLWLLLNHADAQAPDQPLIRPKYMLLLVLVPLVLVGMILQGAFFFSLKADVITSCCGSLFSVESGGGPAGLASLPSGPVKVAWALAIPLMLAASVAFLRGRGPGSLVAWTAGATWLASLGALVVWIGPYLYELPTHLCPFCMLQGEYHRLGYAFYGLWMLLGIAGLGVGLLEPHRERPSLRAVVPALQRRLTQVALVALGAFLGLAGGVVALSNLRVGS